MTEKEALERLMKHFYVGCSSGDIAWSYVEGVSLDEFDGELANFLVDYMDEDDKKDFVENEVEHG